MADHSETRMRLEGCQIEQLNASNGDMLVVLATGALAVLSFRLDGRSVSGMSIRKLPQEFGQTLFRSRASCVASLEPHQLFIGSDVADSVLLSTARKVLQSKKHSTRSFQRSRDEEIAENGDDEEDEEDEEDDLYGESLDRRLTVLSEGTTTAGTNIRIVDRLHCIAPLRDITIGRVGKRKRDDEDVGGEEEGPDLSLIASSGEGVAGGVTILTRELRHEVVNKIQVPRADGVWSFSIKPSAAISDDLGVDRSYDEFMILSGSSTAGQYESILYQITGQTLQEKTDTDFDPTAGRTVECGSIINGAHIVQVLEAEVRVYDQGRSPLTILQLSVTLFILMYSRFRTCPDLANRRRGDQCGCESRQCQFCRSLCADCEG